jgi:MoaD family protein
MLVKIFGTLRLISGKKSVQVDLPGGTTLGDVLQEIIRQIPAMQTELMETGGSLRKDLPLFVNGRNPRLLPGAIDMALQPDDVISLFSPISSGRMNVEALRQAASGKKKG